MKTLLDFFLSSGFSSPNASLLATIFAALLALVVIAAVEVGTKRVLLGFISRFAAKTATSLDDILVQHNVFQALPAWFPPFCSTCFPILSFSSSPV